MDPPCWDYEAFEDRVESWADDRPDVRLVVVFGSRAREDRPADGWSDIDFALVSTAAERYVRDDDWLGELGSPLVSCTEDAPVGGFSERHVIFDGGLEVDFVAVPSEEVTPLGTAPDEVFEVLAHGYRVLVDKDDLASALSSRVDDVADDELGVSLPGDDAFVETVHRCLYRAVWIAKKLRRGELWTAMHALDGRLKQESLLPMLAWHARGVHGNHAWHAGRFLEEWADPRAIDELPETVADYDPSDCWRALFATLDLFQWLSRETAAAADYEYPTTAVEQVAALIDDLSPAGVRE